MYHARLGADSMESFGRGPRIPSPGRSTPRSFRLALVRNGCAETLAAVCGLLRSDLAADRDDWLRGTGGREAELITWSYGLPVQLHTDLRPGTKDAVKQF